jgi:hypothetical protein
MLGVDEALTSVMSFLVSPPAVGSFQAVELRGAVTESWRVDFAENEGILRFRISDLAGEVTESSDGVERCVYFAGEVVERAPARMGYVPFAMHLLRPGHLPIWGRNGDDWTPIFSAAAERTSNAVRVPLHPVDGSAERGHVVFSTVMGCIEEFAFGRRIRRVSTSRRTFRHPSLSGLAKSPDFACRHGKVTPFRAPDF